MIIATVAIFAIGKINASVNITILDDNVTEPSEMFTVELLTTDFNGIAKANITIEDDDGEMYNIILCE